MVVQVQQVKELEELVVVAQQQTQDQEQLERQREEELERQELKKLSAANRKKLELLEKATVKNINTSVMNAIRRGPIR